MDDDIYMTLPAISYLKFPFCLKKDQIEAAHVWVTNGFRGTILYSSGTGKTEIAFECARRAAAKDSTLTTAIDNKECSSYLLSIFYILFHE
jgi:superfamily II DNA or RNA helicase